MRSGRAAIAASYFFYFGAIGVFQPYWPSYLASLGYGAGAIGVLLAVFNGVRLAAPVLCARAADRARDRRSVLWVLGALATLAALALNWLSGALALALGLAAFSLAIHGLMPIVDSLSVERPGGSLRYGWLRLWGSLGFLASSAALGALVARHGPAWVPAALALLVLLTTLTLGALPAPAPARVAAAAVDAGDRRALARLLLIAFLHLTGFGAYYGFYTLYLARAGYGAGTIGLYWSFGVAAEILVFIAAPALLSRVAPVRLLQLALGGSALRWALCAWVPGSRAIMLAAQALHGLGFALFHVVGVRIAPRLVPPSHAVRAQALVSAVGWGAGGIAGSLLAGMLWERWSPAASYGVAAGLAMLAGLLAAGLRLPAEAQAP